MADSSRPDGPLSRAATTGSVLNPSTAARHRVPTRASSQADASPSPKPDPFLRRRSSLLSFSSIEEATQSFADDILDPRTSKRRNHGDDDEISHWHSSPLAFAILPAIAGLLFKNGSAFMTDVLLLGLAAVFMNWSIRLPWDWYYSAQALRRDVGPAEVEVQDETAVDTASSTEGSPKEGANGHINGGAPPGQGSVMDERDKATANLRQQEILALAATFVAPVLAAYLLHAIRGQLSHGATVVVTDFNLSIFLLAAEVRPFRQIMRLVQSRTLHLQRTVSGVDDPFNAVLEERTTVGDLTARLTDLEAKLSEHTIVPPTLTMAQKTDINDLSIEIKKRYEPRLEGLERAVRRYEKRSTTMAMNTEQRLQSLETRLQDALSLAAVAAQHSQNPGIVAKGLQTMSTIIALPLKLAVEICSWPLRAVDDLYVRIKRLLLGPTAPRGSRRKGGKYDGSGREDSRTRESKGSLRKIVR